jgi:catabolite regulation protein CreA
MKNEKLVLTLIFSLFLGLMLSTSAFAEETGIVKLSYKLVQSNSSADTLTMLVKLKVQNMGTCPISEVTAKITSTNNMIIDAGILSLGNINAGATVTSSDRFQITMSAGAGQEPPQKEAIWSVQYRDANGSLITEEVLLN